MPRMQIDRLQIMTVIGALPEERLQRQPVLVDITLEVDMLPAAHSDQLSATLDYRQLAAAATRVAQRGRFTLLETLVWHVALDLQRLTQCRWIAVTVSKPGALHDARSARVHLESGTPAAAHPAGAPCAHRPHGHWVENGATHTSQSAGIGD